VTGISVPRHATWEAVRGKLCPMSVQVRSDSRGKLALVPLALCVLLGSVARAEPEKPRPAPGSFTIENFRLESGVTLPRAIVVYGTYGTLNAAKDNAVLLPSHYMAQSDGYDLLIGEGRALDPRKHFLIMTELFGNGRSSSPSNTPPPLHGPRFPVTTIRDNVEAVRRLLEDGLGIHHLKAVVGFSMGAQQAFQWAVSYPKFADKIVATAGTARCWPHGIVRLDGQIRAITVDPAFQGGNYTKQPVRGIETSGAVWLAWLYSQEWWKRELWKTDPAAAAMTLEQYIEKQSKEFFAGSDANNLILQMRTWQAHDVGTSPGFGGSTEKALRSISVPVLYLPAETDLYFPLSDARQESKWIRKITFAPIPSLWGHPAGIGVSPEDMAFIERKLRAFLGTR
jgi:homoserine O-acetyltransferase/O-succinyltransferase